MTENKDQIRQSKDSDIDLRLFEVYKDHLNLYRDDIDRWWKKFLFLIFLIGSGVVFLAGRSFMEVEDFMKEKIQSSLEKRIAEQETRWDEMEKEREEQWEIRTAQLLEDFENRLKSIEAEQLRIANTRMEAHIESKGVDIIREIAREKIDSASFSEFVYEEFSSDAFPLGTILIWDSENPPPCGWVLCNKEGHSENPDVPELENKFIVGQNEESENKLDGPWKIPQQVQTDQGSVRISSWLSLPEVRYVRFIKKVELCRQ